MRSIDEQREKHANQQPENTYNSPCKSDSNSMKKTSDLFSNCLSGGSAALKSQDAVAKSLAFSCVSSALRCPLNTNTHVMVISANCYHVWISHFLSQTCHLSAGASRPNQGTEQGFCHELCMMQQRLVCRWTRLLWRDKMSSASFVAVLSSVHEAIPPFSCTHFKRLPVTLMTYAGVFNNWCPSSFVCEPPAFSIASTVCQRRCHL